MVDGWEEEAFVVYWSQYREEKRQGKEEDDENEDEDEHAFFVFGGSE